MDRQMSLVQLSPCRQNVLLGAETLSLLSMLSMHTGWNGKDKGPNMTLPWGGAKIRASWIS